MLVTPVKTETSAVGVALGCAGLSDQDRVRWNASQASAAMVAPRAVEQRRRNVNGQLRPSDSEFEWIHQHKLHFVNRHLADPFILRCVCELQRYRSRWVAASFPPRPPSCKHR